MSTEWIQAIRMEGRRIEFPSLLYFYNWATALNRLRCYGVKLFSFRAEGD